MLIAIYSSTKTYNQPQPTRSHYCSLSPAPLSPLLQALPHILPFRIINNSEIIFIISGQRHSWSGGHRLPLPPSATITARSAFFLGFLPLTSLRGTPSHDLLACLQSTLGILNCKNPFCFKNTSYRLPACSADSFSKLFLSSNNPSCWEVDMKINELMFVKYFGLLR